MHSACCNPRCVIHVVVPLPVAPPNRTGVLFPRRRAASVWCGRSSLPYYSCGAFRMVGIHHTAIQNG